MVKKAQGKKEDRRPRIPFGRARLKTQLSAEDLAEFKKRKMVPRVFNDQDGRIQAALNAGYSYVKPEHAESWGESAIGQGNTDLGNRVSKVVSRGNETVLTAFLMEIPRKFYDQDQAEKERINAQVDDAIALGGHGKAEDIEGQYRP